MNMTTDLQQQFFIHLKNTIPPHLSMADELCDLLDISPDSAYRRIRGEKPLSLTELKLICGKFRLSLDQVLQLETDTVVFNAPEINENRGGLFSDYLKGILQYMKFFNTFTDRRILYLCKDLPVFHFYLFPEIAAFKTFFWIKTIRNDPGVSGKKFSYREFPLDDCFILGQQILQEYNLVPSIELWNLECINSTIHQIAYYKEAGLFVSENDFKMVVDSCLKTLDHLEEQSEFGTKFMPGSTDLTHRAEMKLYFNEILLGNNNVYVELDGSRYSFITYNGLNYIITKDARFNEKTFQYFNTLVSRGTLLSGTGEKERTRFFQSLKQKVQALA